MIKIKKYSECYVIKKGIINRKIIVYYFSLLLLFAIFFLNNNFFRLILKINVIFSFYFFYNKEIHENLWLEIMKINFNSKNIIIVNKKGEYDFSFFDLENIGIIKTADTFEKISFYQLEIKSKKNYCRFGNELEILNLKKIENIILNEVLKQYVKV